MSSCPNQFSPLLAATHDHPLSDQCDLEAGAASRPRTGSVPTPYGSVLVIPSRPLNRGGGGGGGGAAAPCAGPPAMPRRGSTGSAATEAGAPPRVAAGAKQRRLSAERRTATLRINTVHARRSRASYAPESVLDLAGIRKYESGCESGGMISEDLNSATWQYYKPVRSSRGVAAVVAVAVVLLGLAAVNLFDTTQQYQQQSLHSWLCVVIQNVDEFMYLGAMIFLVLRRGVYVNRLAAALVLVYDVGLTCVYVIGWQYPARSANKAVGVCVILNSMLRDTYYLIVCGSFCRVLSLELLQLAVIRAEIKVGRVITYEGLRRLLPEDTRTFRYFMAWSVLNSAATLIFLAKAFFDGERMLESDLSREIWFAIFISSAALADFVILWAWARRDIYRSSIVREVGALDADPDGPVTKSMQLALAFQYVTLSSTFSATSVQWLVADILPFVGTIIFALIQVI